MNSMIGTPPKDGSFVALFNDGSGATLFTFLDDGIYDADGNMYDLEYIQTDYSHWFSIPDNFELWFQRG